MALTKTGRKALEKELDSAREELDKASTAVTFAQQDLAEATRKRDYLATKVDDLEADVEEADV